MMMMIDYIIVTKLQLLTATTFVAAAMHIQLIPCAPGDMLSTQHSDQEQH